MKIALEGNFGVGKTLQLEQLKKNGYQVNIETTKWSQWPEKFRENANFSVLGFQFQILLDSICISIKSDQINIFESSPYTLQHVFGEFLLENKFLDVPDYQLQKTYIEKFGWKPDAIIYLYCDPKQCYDRIKSRFLIGEDEKLTLKYLKKIQAKYEIAFDEMNCQIPIYKVNSAENAETVNNNIIDILTQLSLKQRFLR